jgi:hypothetical protein
MRLCVPPNPYDPPKEMGESSRPASFLWLFLQRAGLTLGLIVMFGLLLLGGLYGIGFMIDFLDYSIRP